MFSRLIGKSSKSKYKLNKPEYSTFVKLNSLGKPIALYQVGRGELSSGNSSTTNIGGALRRSKVKSGKKVTRRKKAASSSTPKRRKNKKHTLKSRNRYIHDRKKNTK